MEFTVSGPSGLEGKCLLVREDVSGTFSSVGLVWTSPMLYKISEGRLVLDENFKGNPGSHYDGADTLQENLSYLVGLGSLLCTPTPEKGDNHSYRVLGAKEDENEYHPESSSVTEIYPLNEEQLAPLIEKGVKIEFIEF